MPRTSTAIQDAIADAIRLRFELGREIRTARLDAGSSLRTAAVRAGMSHTQLRRIEMGLVEHLTFIQAGSACAAVGLRLTARAVPGSGAPLDAGQLALLGRLRMRLPVLLPVAAEVPLPLPGDRRAWDAVLGTEPVETPVEAETRLRDIQALERRSLLKLRDSPFDRLILLVADTPHNRWVLAGHRAALRPSFPLDTRAVLASLAEGRAPASSGIALLWPSTRSTLHR